MTHENAIRALRQTPPVIRLVVLRDEPTSDDDIYDTITADLVKKPGHGLGFSIVTHQNGIFISGIVCFSFFLLCCCLLCLGGEAWPKLSTTTQEGMCSSLGGRKV